jgi:hypothetical protein
MDLRVLSDLSDDDGDADADDGSFDGGGEFATCHCHEAQLRGRTKRRDANRQDNNNSIDRVAMLSQERYQSTTYGSELIMVDG